MSQPDGRTPRVDALINARSDARDDDLPGTPPRLARVGGGPESGPSDADATAGAGEPTPEARPEPRERPVGLAGAHVADRSDADKATDEAEPVDTDADDDLPRERTTTTRPAGYVSGAVAPLFRDEEPAARTTATTVETVTPVAATPAEEIGSDTVVVEHTEDPETTTVLPAADRDRAAEREARAKRLGIVAAAPPVAEPVVPARRPKRTTDKWHGSLGFFLLRLVTAAMLLAQGYAHLSHWTETKQFFANSVLPQPEYFALGVVIAELVAGLLLLLGLAVRIGGALLLAVQVLLLVFFVYGRSGAIYTPGLPGFKGDLPILLGTIGLLFLLLGGGGLTFDRLMRRNRARAKEERLLGNTV